MDGSTIVNNIIIGIIAGVSAGLILSAFTYARQYIDHKMERREQIGYIRQMVEAFQEDILSSQQTILEINDPSLPNTPEVVRELRWATLKDEYEEVVKTLEGRAVTLQFRWFSFPATHSSG